jgi:Sushi repeat (SCR repeat)
MPELIVILPTFSYVGRLAQFKMADCKPWKYTASIEWKDISPKFHCSLTNIFVCVMREGILCPALRVQNATLSTNSTAFGITVVVQCDIGHRINGLLEQTVNCQADGHWEPEDAECLRKTTENILY